MSKELTVLGQELCTEFDDRRNILKKLGIENHQNIKNQLENLRQQETVDASERRGAKLQLQAYVKSLLDSFSQEENRLRQILKENQNVQTRELKLWIKENQNQLNAWQKAVRYTRTGL